MPYIRPHMIHDAAVKSRHTTELASLANLAAVTATKGASLVGVQDAAASLVGANVETAIAELATPITLTVGSESTNVIAVVVAGPAHVARYHAQIYDANMLDGLVGAWRLAETGVGAEVSTTLKPGLLFTTNAAGVATLSVTDVAGASGLTVYLKVTPASVQAGAGAGASALVPMTFD